LLTIGAGDVTNFVNQIKETFDKQWIRLKI
jgi:hypothetical protein